MATEFRDYTKLTPALLRHYITPFKGRKLRVSEPVEVYRNLNARGFRYSIRQRGLVIGHCNALMLRDVEFVVQHGGWLRALALRRRNVHAFARGYVTPSGMGQTAEKGLHCEVRYHLDTGTFQWLGTVVTGGMVIAFNERGCSGAYFTYPR